MDLKLLEDLLALADARSFVRAAEKRNVTHPAFGRRIRALEIWAGTPLVDRSQNPLQLTAAGKTLLAQAEIVVQGMHNTRQQISERCSQVGHAIRLGTGRTLARTVVADWLVQLAKPKGPLHERTVEVRTGSMSDMSEMMQRHEVDFVCCYEHPALSFKLSPQRFRHLTMVQDKLVPVSKATVQGLPLHALESGPLIAYGPALSLGALLSSHGHTHWMDTKARTRFVCDSADAIQEYALKGLGLAWLPWSMVATDCKRGTLVALGKRSDEVHFEVRLYRRAARQSADIEAVWAATDK